MSPLHFQKQLRLQEARRFTLDETGADFRWATTMLLSFESEESQSGEAKDLSSLENEEAG